jgi:hypothetical protein
MTDKLTCAYVVYIETTAASHPLPSDDTVRLVGRAGSEGSAQSGGLPCA